MIDEAVEAYARSQVSKEIAAYERLTPRLRQVLRMIGEGRSTKQIALKLKITAKTVEFHRAKLMEDLRVHGIAELVHYAIRVGAVPP